jgi:hypothetical protein
VWNYNPSTNEWTWIGGSTRNNQHSQPSVGPSGRWSAALWYVNNSTLMIHGGYGCDNVSCADPDVYSYSYCLNDLWEYHIANNTWVWLRGDLKGGSRGRYGELNVPSPLNDPPGRSGEPIYWTDRLSNSHYIFGGFNDSGWFNNMWRLSEGVWTWVGGSSAINDPGHYTGRDVENPLNLPSARQGPAACLDRHNNLWMFGGGTPTTASAELWTFRNGTWVWISGEPGNSNGNYQTKGVASSTAFPKSRYNSKMVCDPNDDILWIFGGNGFDNEYKGIFVLLL